MVTKTHKFKLHRIFQDEDSVIGSFMIVNEEVIYPNKAAEHNCSMIPAGPISAHTHNRIVGLLKHERSTMYLEKVE